MKSGIYIIRNTTNDKAYVGSSCALSRRRGAHFRLMEAGRHPNAKLQRAFGKYGREAFTFDVLEYCDIDQLLAREQHYLDTLKPEYNIRKVSAYVPDKASPPSDSRGPEVVEKWRKTISDMPQERLELWRDRLSESASNRDDEVVEKIARGRWKPVRQFTLDGEFVREWACGKHAAAEYDVNPICISNCCRGKQKTAAGFRWAFSDPDDANRSGRRPSE